MRSKINWKVNLWAHLWGVFLIRLTDVENPLQMWVEPSNGGPDVRGSKRQTFAFCILAFKSHCQVHLTSSGVHLSPHCYYHCHSLPTSEFPTWTGDQWLSRNLPNLQATLGLASTALSLVNWETTSSQPLQCEDSTLHYLDRTAYALLIKKFLFIMYLFWQFCSSN